MSELSREEIALRRRSAAHVRDTYISGNMPEMAAAYEKTVALCDMAEKWLQSQEAGMVSVQSALALPLSPVELSTPGSFDFGWCVVDANRRVIGYCMTEQQARQLAAPFSSAPAPADQDVPTDASQSTGSNDG